MDERQIDFLRREQENFERRQPYVEQLTKANPNISPISAMVIAGDYVQRDRMKEEVESGRMTADKAYVFVGSFGRFEFITWAYENGHMAEDKVFELLPHEWSASDPDDSDPRYLAIFRKAKAKIGRYLTDEGKRLPVGKVLTVFRGESQKGAPEPSGISWTLDEKIASKFASGAGTRQSNLGGTIYVRQVKREDILAYITGRKESEVIIDPKNVMAER